LGSFFVDAMSRRVSFVADLHLFSRRSEAPRYWEAMSRAAGRSAAFVLGGDIFDFRWSTLRTPAATVEAAVHWIEHLAASHPQCHFHYVLGNHDYYGRFLDRLAQRRGAVENLSCHAFYVRLGDSVFLHGDAAMRRMTPERLLRFRARWLDDRPPGRLHRRAYDLLIQSGLHRPIPYLVYPKRRVARRLRRYLQRQGEGPHSGARHVYFGHIHRPMAAYRYRGLVFHNGGAPIGGQPLRILEAVLGEGESGGIAAQGHAAGS
jgi:UDP-2,3-diacylglucosamine hydrolase